METEDGRQTVARDFLNHSDFDKLPWQFDFEKHLWTCKAIRIINGIVAVLWGLIMTFSLFGLLAQGAIVPAIIGIVATWVFVALWILVVRMICEWSLITSKAAQLYVLKL